MRICSVSGCNNRKNNLRVCTIYENARNKRKIKKMSSIYKGVTWNSVANKWQARIGPSGKTSLGYFGEERDAAIAYNKAARRFYGEFAKLNNFEENIKCLP